MSNNKNNTNTYQNLALKSDAEVLPRRDVLAEVSEMVARDARVDPGKYLNDSIVPEGGE